MAKSIKIKILSWLRTVIDRLFPESTSDTSDKTMDKAIELWLKLYYNEPPWLEETHSLSLNLPVAISAEFARLIMVEFDIKTTGSPRADFLNKQFLRLSNNLRTNLEEALAIGGIIFKPYVVGGQIYTDFITQDRFLPVEYTDDEITAAVFLSRITKGHRYYYRLEKQSYNRETHTHSIVSKYFVSSSSESIGHEIEATKHPCPIEDYTISNVDRPLFSFYKNPAANKVDKESPLGVSVYSTAIEHIKEADKQWDRFLWEFEGGELAVDAEESALRARPVFDKSGNEIKLETPKTRDRLFRKLNFSTNGDKPFYSIFSPALRDTALAHGLDVILKRIEFDVALAYGTLSDPQSVDKTAEEVKTSKQRSFTTVSNMQSALQTALENYIYALDQYTEACNLAPTGEYETMWNWGDGVLEDRDKETQTRLQEVNSNITSKVEYLKWRYGVTEAQALDMMPKDGYTSFFGEDS